MSRAAFLIMIVMAGSLCGSDKIQDSSDPNDSERTKLAAQSEAVLEIEAQNPIVQSDAHTGCRISKPVKGLGLGVALLAMLGIAWAANGSASCNQLFDRSLCLPNTQSMKGRCFDTVDFACSGSSETATLSNIQCPVNGTVADIKKPCVRFGLCPEGCKKPH